LKFHIVNPRRPDTSDHVEMKGLHEAVRFFFEMNGSDPPEVTVSAF